MRRTKPLARFEEFADLLQRLHTLPKPTIAAVNGDALAGGAGLMMACDLAIAAETARIGYPEVKRGLVAAIIMYDLTRQVGDRRARQLLLGGEPISSKVAQDWGLVNKVTPSDACLHEAIGVAEELAQSGPKALALDQAIAGRGGGWPARLERSGRGERVGSVIRRGARGDSRVCREALARMGLVPGGGGSAVTHDTGGTVPWVWDQTVGGVLEQTALRLPDHDALVFPGLNLRWSGAA